MPLGRLCKISEALNTDSPRNNAVIFNLQIFLSINGVFLLPLNKVIHSFKRCVKYLSYCLSVYIIQSKPKTEIFVWYGEDKYWSSSWRRPCVCTRRWPQADWQKEEDGCCWCCWWLYCSRMCSCMSDWLRWGRGAWPKHQLAFLATTLRLIGSSGEMDKRKEHFGKVELMLLHFVEYHKFKWNIALHVINATRA